MDERLIAADPCLVMRQIAEAYLAAPAITAEQGAIRLAPHQVDAASRLLHLLGTHGGAVLADATGLGKTFVAIAVARLLAPAMVIAPAGLRGMWRESLERTGVHAVIESYEALSRGNLSRAERPTLLILDEAHHARNPRARRYAALADLAWGSRVLLVTATPVHNRARDLRALVALFLGSRAHAMSEDELRPLIVRRTSGASGGAPSLPSIATPRWLPVPSDSDTLRAIRSLPPAVSAADGGSAHALLLLGLIRAWSSSEAALRATLKRRLQRAAALGIALESGHLPERRELDSALVVDEAIQLGFPELFAAATSRTEIATLRAALDRHVDGVRRILRSLNRLGGASDAERSRLLRLVRERHQGRPVVAFTQFADTARAAYRACAHLGGVALVTGDGARIASGRATIDEIVHGFDVAEARTSSAMPLDLLIATDVLSEGLSLRRAGVLVHLDLPWTVARLQQRVGRLRRIGSPHRQIVVYAIGPPVESRELLPVVRALQRKARLSSGISGLDELSASLPLLGRRLTHATAAIEARGDANAIEELRQALMTWIIGNSLPRPARVPSAEPCALGLVSNGEMHRLVAVQRSQVSEKPADLLHAVHTLSDRASTATVMPLDIAESAIAKWLDEERGREIARPVIDAPSAIQASVMRSLQETLSRATRTERVPLASRVTRCRRLVIAARGIGAELALSRLAASASWPDIDALERLLVSRAPVENTGPRAWNLVALLGQNEARRAR